MKIYVDGCSYTAAAGLPSKYKIANLINADADNSFGGKSNFAIFRDTHANLVNYDMFVINLTYSNRFQLFDDGVHIPILSNHEIPVRLENTPFETLYPAFHKTLFLLSDSEFYSQLSDAIADSLVALFEQNKKKYVIHTWEERKGLYSNKMTFMQPDHSYKLSDGHLNEQGMTMWAEQILGKINEQ